MDITNLNTKTIYFLNDDILWSSNFGGWAHEHSNNLKNLLDDKDLKKLIIDLKIISDDLYEKYKKFLVPTINTDFTGNGYNLSKINTDFKSFIIELNKNPIFIKLTLKASVDPEKKITHVICIVIEKIDTTYKIYVGNSGYGGWYHDTKMDDSIYNESILEFDNISKIKLEYFFNFISLHHTIDEFYNVSIPLLLSRDLTFDEKKVYKDLIKDYTHKDENYFEMQFIGSCSFKSVLYATHIFMTNINNIQRKDVENFFLICRLYTYKKLLNKILLLDDGQFYKFLHENDDEANSIVAYLQKNTNENIYFDCYYYVCYQTGFMDQFNHFQDFLEFVKY